MRDKDDEEIFMDLLIIPLLVFLISLILLLISLSVILPSFHMGNMRR